MNLTEQIITIGMCILGTVATRFLPFIVFSEKKKTPPVIEYLGSVLPLAVFGMLLVYSFKDVNFTSGTYGIPELLAVAFTILLHLRKRNMLLSIAGGTGLYILLLQIL